MGLATLWKVLGRSVLLPGAQVMVHGVASGSIPSSTQEAVTEATLMDAPNEALPRIIHYFFRMELLFCRRADSVFIKPHCVRFTQLRKGVLKRGKKCKVGVPAGSRTVGHGRTARNRKHSVTRTFYYRDSRRTQKEAPRSANGRGPFGVPASGNSQC